MRFLTSLSLAALVLAVCSAPHVSAFTPVPIVTQRQNCAVSRLFSTKDSSAPEETEVERLLRKARELRAEAEAEEHAVHASLLQKKKAKDSETDKVIDDLFYNPNKSLLDQLREKRCSIDMLIRVVDRLHEREITARGLEHVESSLHHDHTKFQRVSEVNEEELARVEGLIDRLVEACAVLDEEFLMEKNKLGESPHRVTHTEAEHWHVGERAKVLHDKVREMRREHEEQFQERLNSFYEAQRKKDLPPPDKKKKSPDRKNKLKP